MAKTSAVVRAALVGRAEVQPTVVAPVTGSITMDADRNPIKPAVVLRVEGGRFRFADSIAPMRANP